MDINSLPVEVEDMVEIEENPYHPLNDQYHREIRHVQDIIVAVQRQMTPRHVQVVKLKFTGMRQVDIAQKVGITPQTVSTILNSANGERLMNLLKYVDAAMVGPTAAHRTAVLNRIMVRNEEKNPKVAIMAIGEMNRMEVNKFNMEQDSNPGQTTIIINQDDMPRTPLDD